MNDYAIAMTVSIVGSVLGDFLMKQAAGRRRPSADRLSAIPGMDAAALALDGGRPRTETAPPPGNGGLGGIASRYRPVRRWLRLLQLIAGLVLLMAHFAGFLIALKLAPLTVTIPLMSCTYILTTLMGKFFLHEPVNRLRWTGIGVIIVGVIMLELSTKI